MRQVTTGTIQRPEHARPGGSAIFQRTLAQLEQLRPELGEDGHPLANEHSERIAGMLMDDARAGRGLSRAEAGALLEAADRCRAGHDVDRAIVALAPESERNGLLAGQCLTHINRTLGMRSPDRPRPDGAAISPGEELYLRQALDRVRGRSAHEDVLGPVYRQPEGGQGPESPCPPEVSVVCAASRIMRAGGPLEFAALAAEYFVLRDVLPVEMCVVPSEGEGGPRFAVVIGRETFGEDEGHLRLPPPQDWSAGALLVDPHGGQVLQGHALADWLGEGAADAGVRCAWRQFQP